MPLGSPAPFTPQELAWIAAHPAFGPAAWDFAAADIAEDAGLDLIGR